MALLGESRGLGGEIKLFPPPIFKGEHERWEDWSWQLKAYVALYKPVAQELMTRVEGSASAIDDIILQQEENNSYPGLRFAKQLHYLLANLTDDAARLIVRLNEPGNGFETWRQLYDRFALPSRAKGVSLLSQLLEHQFRDAHFEADLTSFIVLKNKHERATGTSLSDDLLVTLMMNKTRGQLQQHLRLQANSLRTFDQVLVIIKEYYQAFGTSTEATPAQQAQTLRQCFKLSTDLISSRDLPRILIDFRSFPDDPPCLVLSS